MPLFLMYCLTIPRASTGQMYPGARKALFFVETYPGQEQTDGSALFLQLSGIWSPGNATKVREGLGVWGVEGLAGAAR